MKKFTTIILATLCLSAFTNKASAQFSGGNGTENNPYIITTPQQLAQLATFVNAGNEDYNAKYYKLGDNIDLSAYQSGTGWTPIGVDYSFKGYFDGNNKKITGLYINNSGLEYAGLFGYINTTVIETQPAVAVENLIVENVNIRGNNYVGGIAGKLKGSGMKNCYSTGEISGNSTVGGVAGYIEAYLSDKVCGLSRCASTCKVSGNEDIGGMVGELYGYCFVTYSYSTGKVSGKDKVGGVLGRTYNGGVGNSYSISEVSGNEYVGGIAGYYGGSYPYGTDIVDNCVALNPSVKGTGTYVARVMGDNAPLYKNAAYDGILNNNGNTVWNNQGANKRDGEDMTQQSIYADGTLGGRFVSTDGWTTQNGKLPGLFGKPVPMPVHLGGVGIEQLGIMNYELRIYPNPTRGELTITTSDYPICDMRLFDITGRQISVVGQSEIGQSEIAIDISHLKSGIYFLRIQTENGVVVRKVVKN